MEKSANQTTSKELSSKKETNPVEYYKREILPKLDWHRVLFKHSPEDKGYYLTINCPSCKRHEAYIYKSSGTVECNRRNKCQYKGNLLGLMIGKEGCPKGEDFFHAMNELAKRADIQIPYHRLGPEHPDDLNCNSAPLDEELERIADEREQVAQAVMARYIAYCRDCLTNDISGLRETLATKRGVTEDAQKTRLIGFFRSTAEFRKLISDDPRFIDEATNLGILPNGHSMHSRREGYFTFPWAGENSSGRKQIVNVWHRYSGMGGMPLKKEHPAWKESIDPSDPKSAGEKIPKMLGLRNRESTIPYLGNNAKLSKEDHCLVVEGLLDAVIAHDHGVTNTVAILNAVISSSHIKYFREQAKQCYLMLDGDEAGEKGALRSAMRMLREGIEVYIVDPSFLGNRDPDEFILEHGKDRFLEYKHKSSHALRYIAKSIAEKINGASGVWNDPQIEQLKIELDRLNLSELPPRVVNQLELYFWSQLKELGIKPEIIKGLKACVAPLPVKRSKRADPLLLEFDNRPDGLYKRLPGDPVGLKKVAGKISVIAQYSSPDLTEWGRIVECENHDGLISELRIPDCEFLGDARLVRERLTKFGLKLESPKNQSLSDCIRYLHESDVSNRVRFVEYGGWLKDTFFVLPDKTIGISDQVYRFNSESPLTKSFGTKGDLGDWQSQVGKYMSGNNLLVLTTSLSFCGPILPLLKAESIGIHIHGPSSIGKTSASNLSASVWGDPTATEGIVSTWHGTSNGFEFRARQRNEYFFILDEIGSVRKDLLGDMIYLFGNGTGKVRGNADETNRRVAKWVFSWLSNGEYRSDEISREGGKESTAGQEVRMIDLAADAGLGFGIYENLHGFPSSQALTDHIKANSATFFGAPIREFLERIVAEKDKYIERIKKERQRIISSLLKGESPSGQVVRVAEKFAIIAAVGELAIEFGILPLTHSEAEKSATVMFSRWIESRGIAFDASEPHRIVKKMRAIIERFGFSKFPLIDGYGGCSGEYGLEELERKQELFGFRREGPNGTEYLVNQTTFEGPQLYGNGYINARNVLRSLGYLVKDSSGGPTCPVRIPGVTIPKRMYVIRENILREAGDSDTAIGPPRSLVTDASVDDPNDEPLYSL
jgi:putative DNA primase/helicase